LNEGNRAAAEKSLQDFVEAANASLESGNGGDVEQTLRELALDFRTADLQRKKVALKEPVKNVSEAPAKPAELPLALGLLKGADGRTTGMVVVHEGRAHHIPVLRVSEASE
jgi:hypothetical protein